MPRQQHLGPDADGSKPWPDGPVAVRDALPDSLPDNAVRDMCGETAKDQAVSPLRIHPADLARSRWTRISSSQQVP